MRLGVLTNSPPTRISLLPALVLLCLPILVAQAQSQARLLPGEEVSASTYVEPPTIIFFESAGEPIIAGTYSYLSFNVRDARTMILDPGGIELQRGQNVQGLRPLQTTTYTLTASNEAGSVSAQATIEVRTQFIIHYFEVLGATSVGQEDAVTLRWQVEGYAPNVSVSIDGVGPVAMYDEIDVVPGFSREYRLNVSAQDQTESRVVSVQVVDDFNRSRFYLSFSPDEIDPLPPDLSQYVPFTVHLLGRSLDGSLLAGVEFGLEIPEGLMVTGSNFFVPMHLNIMNPPDYVVGLGYCLPIEPALHRIASIEFAAVEQSAIDEGVIRLRPAARPSIPGRVAYATCNQVLELSELDSPLHAVGIGPPLPLNPQTQVPVLEIDLRAERRARGVALRWAPLPIDLVDRLVLRRSVEGRAPEAISSRQDEELEGFEAFEDLAAPAGVALEYTLSGYVDDELILQAHAKLATPIAPLKSALVEAYPNPFNPSTNIRFDASRAGRYEFAIHSASGRRIRTLTATVGAAGTHEIRWNGLDDTGRPAASGVYFVELRAEDARGSLRIVLLK